MNCVDCLQIRYDLFVNRLWTCHDISQTCTHVLCSDCDVPAVVPLHVWPGELDERVLLGEWEGSMHTFQGSGQPLLKICLLGSSSGTGTHIPLHTPTHTHTGRHHGHNGRRGCPHLQRTGRQPCRCAGENKCCDCSESRGESPVCMSCSHSLHT